MTEDTNNGNGTRELSKSERNELTRIVKARYKLLRTQAKARIADIIATEKRQADRDNQELIDKYRERISPVLERLNEVNKELAAIANDAQDEGIRISGDRVWAQGEYDYNARYDEAARTQLVIAEIDRAELNALEELLITELESAAAQAFLARIPTVETLVEQGTRSLEQATA